ncbi:MAG TPA: P1 family peptidase [Bryobacteraceae bacterium]|nr:P1 family peptidase [Bryobacteraceae bacterium]
MRSGVLWMVLATSLFAQPKRARDLEVPFDGTPGALNAITDIAGVEVGHTTLIEGDSIRTGVTVVWPRGKQSDDPTFGGWFSQNGNGEMTGTTWLEESGFLEGAVFITNTHSVGVVRDASIHWQVDHKRKLAVNSFGDDFWSLPIVAETWDGRLNDINGFHVKPEHVYHAMDSAGSGPVPEGNVGGGTGMVCFGFKGGIGTSSRVAGAYKVAALVQCNCGSKKQLRIAGVPVGQELSGPATASVVKPDGDVGSIIIVIATDAPLLPTQLKRLARRATMGLSRMGATSGNGSGDIFIAFSTANANSAKPSGSVANLSMLPNDSLNPIFEATVQATEEAITNALVAAEDMTGVNGHKVTALPHDDLQRLLKKYNR